MRRDDFPAMEGEIFDFVGVFPIVRPAALPHPLSAMTIRPAPLPCRVLLADENDEFLDGLTDWFEDQPEIEIVGRAHSRAETMQRISRLKPDLVLIDTGLPDGNGFDVVRSIKAGSNPPLVVMMSFHDSDWIRFTASSDGADGCITKANIAENLVSQIEALIDPNTSGSQAARIPSDRHRSIQ